MENTGKKWCFGFKKYNGAQIRILRMELSEDEAAVTLRYFISVADREGTLWYRFSPENKSMISHEVADGVVVTLLPFALRGGYNIYSELPISNQLWFQITQQLIPQYCTTSQEIWHTEIHAPLVIPAYHPDKTATAMSCGIDSFTTFFQYTHDMPEEQWKVNLLTFFENGAHHGGVIGHSGNEQAVFQGQLDHVRAFCEENRYPLAAINSNLDEFLSEMFWRDSYHYTHAFRNAGFVLLLQKAIRTYYYAGVSDISHFSASLWDDTEKQEKWLFPNLSTESTRFYSVSTSLNRIEKTRYISQFPETYDHLLVCFAGGENCGKCSKCVRLLLTLDYLNLLEKYKNSVPIEMYQKDKKWYELQMLALRKADYFMDEVYRLSRQQGIRFSVLDHCRGSVHALYIMMLESSNTMANVIARTCGKLFRNHKR